MYYSNTVEIGWDTIIKPDTVYICTSDIICKKGRFSKGSLVMLKPDPHKQNILNVADFVSVSKNSVRTGVESYSFLFADKNKVDDFQCGQSEFTKYFVIAEDISEKLKANHKRVSRWFDIFAYSNIVPVFCFVIAYVMWIVAFKFDDNMINILGSSLLIYLAVTGALYKLIMHKVHALRREFHMALADYVC